MISTKNKTLFAVVALSAILILNAHIVRGDASLSYEQGKRSTHVVIDYAIEKVKQNAKESNAGINLETVLKLQGVQLHTIEDQQAFLKGLVVGLKKVDISQTA